jgi:hypothetical protein
LLAASKVAVSSPATIAAVVQNMHNFMRGKGSSSSSSMLLLPLLLVLCASLSQTHAQGQALPQARCQLLLQGSGPTTTAAAACSASPTSGAIAAASLQCSGAQVTIGINNTLLGRFVASSFKGVQVDAESACQQRALGGSLRGTPVAALLYFCVSSTEVLLEAPVVQDVRLGVGDQQQATALIVVAGQARVRISGGRIDNNRASSAIVVAEQAMLSLENSTSVSGNRGTDGVAVYVAQNASVAITYSRIDNNTAVGSSGMLSLQTYGAGLLLYGSASVVMESSSLSGDTNGFAGGWYAKQYSRIVIRDSLVSNNTAAQVSCHGWPASWLDKCTDLERKSTIVCWIEHTLLCWAGVACIVEPDHAHC